MAKIRSISEVMRLKLLLSPLFLVLFLLLSSCEFERLQISNNQVPSQVLPYIDDFTGNYYISSNENLQPLGQRGLIKFKISPSRHFDIAGDFSHFGSGFQFHQVNELRIDHYPGGREIVSVELTIQRQVESATETKTLTVKLNSQTIERPGSVHHLLYQTESLPQKSNVHADNAEVQRLFLIKAIR